MNSVLASASEAEIGTLFENTRKATILHTALKEMGYPQPPTPVQTDNSTACGIANDNIKQQRLRAINMRFFWICDRVQQNQFNIYWAPGKRNLADYYTKHHSAAHHQQMRSLYLHSTPPEQTINSAIAQALHVLRGCVKPALQSPALPRFQVSQNTQASVQAHCHDSTPAGTAVLSLTHEAAEPIPASL
jgi:hypothetical protein